MGRWTATPPARHAGGQGSGSAGEVARGALSPNGYCLSYKELRWCRGGGGGGANGRLSGPSSVIREWLPAGDACVPIFIVFRATEQPCRLQPRPGLDSVVTHNQHPFESQPRYHCTPAPKAVEHSCSNSR